MIRIGHTCDDEDVVFTAEGAAPGLVGRMLGTKTKAGDVDRWAAGNAGRCDALGALRAYGEDRPGSIRFESNRIVASHAAVAALGAAQARTLGLPSRPPFVLSTDTNGVIGSPSFKLTAHWLDTGQPVTSRRRGAFLETAKGTFLIPEPLFSVIELADGFDAGTVDLPEHWAALARFRRLLDPDGASGDPAEMSDFLRGLRIYTGSALSLALSGADDDVDFDPVLFDADTTRKAADDGRPLAESDGMLTGDMLRTFQRHARTGFRAFDAAKRSYLLGGSTYLVVDDDVEAALQVIREKQQAGPAERRAFAAIPARRSPNGWPRRRGRAMTRRDRRTRTPEKKSWKPGRRPCSSRRPSTPIAPLESGYGRSRAWTSCLIPRTSGCRKSSHSNSAGSGYAWTRMR